MPTIVGTVYVRVKAVTDGLAQDISDGISRSGALDSASEQSGKALNKGMARGFSSDNSVTDSIEKVTSESADKAGGKAGRRFGGRFSKFAVKDFDLVGDTFEKSMDRMATRAGRNSAKKISGVFNKAVSFKIPPLVPLLGAALPGILGTLKLIGFYFNALVAWSGQLATALAGVGVAVLGLGAGVVLGIGPLFAAFKAETPELENFKELATEVGTAWKDGVGKATQNSLLPYLERSLALTTELIPSFERYGRNLGHTAGKYTEIATASLTSEKNQRALNEVQFGSLGIWDKLGAASARFIDMLLPFFAAAMPVSNRFAGSIENIAEKMQGVVNAGYESGTLTAAFDTWYERAERFGRALADLFYGVWNLFKIGADTADAQGSGLDTLVEKMAQFRWWTATSKVEIENMFSAALETSGKFNESIGLIIERMWAPVQAGDNSGINEFLDKMNEADGFLERFMDLISDFAEQAGDSMYSFLETLLSLLETLNESGALGGLLNALTAGLEALVAVLNIPGIGKGLGYLLLGFTTLKGLQMVPLIGTLTTYVTRLVSSFAQGVAIRAFSASAEGLSTGLTAASTGMGKLQTSALTAGAGASKSGGLFARFGAMIATALSTAAAAASFFWTSFIAPLLPFIGIAVAVVAAIVAIYLAIKNWDKLTEIVSNIWNAISGFFSRLPETLSNAADALWGWIKDAASQAWGAIQDFFATIIPPIMDFIAKLPGIMWNAYGALISWIVDSVPAFLLEAAKFLNTVQDWAYDFVGKIPGWIAGAATALWSWLTDGGDGGEGPSRLAQFGEAIGNFLKELPGKIIDWLKDAIPAMWRWAVDAIPKLLETLGKLLFEVLKFLTKLPREIGNFLITKAVPALWGFVKIAVPFLLKALGNLIAAIAGFLISLPGKIGGWLADAVTALWEWVKDAVPAVVRKLGELALAVFSWIGGFLRDLPIKMAFAAGQMTRWLVDSIPVLITKLTEFATTVWNWVTGFIVELPTKIWNASVAIVQWLVDVIPDLAVKLGTFQITIWTWIIEFIAALPGKIFGAVSAIVGWIGTAIPTAAIKLGELAGSVWGWITGFIAGIPGQIAGAATAIWSWVADAVSTAATKLGEIATKISDWITELPGKVIEWATDIGDKVTDVGKDLVEGIWQGIKDAKDWISDKVKGFAKDVLGAFGLGFLLGSPSRATAEMGGFLIDGLALGMDRNVAMAVKSARSAADKTMAGFSAGLSAPSLNTSVATSELQRLSRLGVSASNNFGDINTGSQVTYVTVKIGDRDITDIVDVQMDRRVGQIATTLRKRS